MTEITLDQPKVRQDTLSLSLVKEALLRYDTDVVFITDNTIVPSGFGVPKSALIKTTESDINRFRKNASIYKAASVLTTTERDPAALVEVGASFCTFALAIQNETGNAQLEHFPIIPVVRNGIANYEGFKKGLSTTINPSITLITAGNETDPQVASDNAYKLSQFLGSATKTIYLPHWKGAAIENLVYIPKYLSQDGRNKLLLHNGFSNQLLLNLFKS